MFVVVDIRELSRLKNFSILKTDKEEFNFFKGIFWFIKFVSVEMKRPKGFRDRKEKDMRRGFFLKSLLRF